MFQSTTMITFNIVFVSLLMVVLIIVTCSLMSLFQYSFNLTPDSSFTGPTTWEWDTPPPHVPCHFSGAYYTLVTWDHVLSPSKLASLRIVRTVRKQQFILKERREKKIKFDHFFHFRNLPSFRVLRTWDLWDTGGPHLGDNAVPQKLC